MRFPIVPPQRITPYELYQQWISQLDPLTAKAYTAAWRKFATANGVDVPDAVYYFLSNGPLEANQMVANLRSYLIEEKAAGATINARMAALKALLSYASDQNLVNWTIKIKRAKEVPVSDRRGPEPKVVSRLFELMSQNKSQVGIRNYAIAKLLYVPALRCCEVVELNVEHVHLDRSTLSILGKARGGRELVTMPQSTRQAIEDWLDVRPSCKSPALFVALKTKHFGNRMSANHIKHIFEKHDGVRPHGLRHSAVTRALDLTDGNIRAVQKFSRHASPNQVLAYDDCRRDLGGQVADLLDSEHTGGTTTE